MNANNDEDSKENYAKWLWRLVWAGIGGLFVVISYAALKRTWVAASVGCMVAGAAWMGGSILGFLFGVPRTRAANDNPKGTGSTEEIDDAARGRKANSPYRPNTSLDEISDWLTKIIVGVGLTQLYSLTGKLDALGLYIAQGLGGEQNKAFALSIFLYFAFCGFLFGYLWARLGVLPALRIADNEDWQPESKGAIFLSKVPDFLRRGKQNLMFQTLETIDVRGERLKSRSDFLSIDEVAQLIRMNASEERLTSEPILLFETSKQRTWLVATNQFLYCVLDDENTRKTGRLVQWSQPISQISFDSVRAHDYKERTGTIDIGKRTHWLYSKALHPNPASLEKSIQALIERAQHL